MTIIKTSNSSPVRRWCVTVILITAFFSVSIYGTCYTIVQSICTQQGDIACEEPNGGICPDYFYWLQTTYSSVTQPLYDEQHYSFSVLTSGRENTLDVGPEAHIGTWRRAIRSWSFWGCVVSDYQDESTTWNCIKHQLDPQAATCSGYYP